jgi:phage tail sheath gpL-like
MAVEFDGSRAQQGPGLLSYRALLIGQKTSAGSATANTLQRITSADEALALGGRGSQIHRMARAWFTNNASTEVYVGVLADNGSGVAATGTLTVTGTATAAGTLSLYAGGQLVSVGVASGDTAATVAASIAAALPSTSNLPVTGAVGGTGSEHIVTATARHKGTAGNNIDLRLNYQDGEATPAGISVTIVAMASGATNPVLTSLIAALGDTWFHVIAHPYTDSTSLTAIETELASRWGPLRMIDGVAVTSAAGTVSALGTLGGGRNSKHSVIVAQPGKSPLTPPDEFAAATAAVVAKSANNDPAQPLQTLALAGVLPPAEADLFTLQERNLLLYDGIATTKAASGGGAALERVITTYQTNAAGSPDTSYLDVTTMLTLLYARYSFRTRFQAKFARHKLANDGTRVGAGQAVLTPKIAKSEALGWFRDLEERGLFEGFDQFKADLVVERNASDPTRLDFLLSPNLVNQFIVGAAKVQFLL